MFIAGLILWLGKKNGLKMFSILFCVALICRFISWYCLTKMYEPKISHNKTDSFTFKDFISRARESNFVKFVIYVSLTSFAVNIGSPFLICIC